MEEIGVPPSESGIQKSNKGHNLLPFLKAAVYIILALRFSKAILL